MGGEAQVVLEFQVERMWVGGGGCALHRGGVDFFWTNPLSSYNLGQKCEGEWTLPCLVLRWSSWNYWQLQILSPFPKRTMLRCGWIISDLQWTTLTRVGWGEVSTVPNPRERLSVGERVQNFDTLFVQDWRLVIFKTHQFQATDVKSCNQKTSPYALR